MRRFNDTIGGDPITFYYVERRTDLVHVARFVRGSRFLGIDTESTGVNCYRPGWELRTVQIANADKSFVIPARYRGFVRWMVQQDVQWIGHNGPHDVRSINQYLGADSGMVCVAETYLPAHHSDSRNMSEGGIGFGLKEQAIRYVGRDAGKWETQLKAVFKEILIPIPGEVYKSGPRKGTQKYRKAKLGEGWSLVDPTHPAYIAYAAADPLLTYRLWAHYFPTVQEFAELYGRDWRIQQACDALQRRGIRLDVEYTRRLSKAYLRRAHELQAIAAEYGCDNINSTVQIADTLIYLGVDLRARTKTGRFKTDDKLLRAIAKAPETTEEAREFIRAVLGAKQMLKRRASYTEAMLREMGTDGRVHASIKSLGARTARMSVSEPPFQQLPTKDREDDE